MTLPRTLPPPPSPEARHHDPLYPSFSGFLDDGPLVHPICAVGCSSSEQEPELPSQRCADPGSGQAERDKGENVRKCLEPSMSLTTGAPNATVTIARMNTEGNDNCILSLRRW